MMVSDIKLRGKSTSYGNKRSPAFSCTRSRKIHSNNNKKYICKNKARTSKFDFRNQCCRCQGHVFFTDDAAVFFGSTQGSYWMKPGKIFDALLPGC